MIRSLPIRRRVVVAAVVAATVLAVSVVALRVGRPGSNRDEPARTADSDSSDSRDVSADGDASAPSGSEDEAVSTAVGYAAGSQRWLYLSDDQLAAAIAEVTAPESRVALTDQVLADVRPARERLAATSGRVWWIVRPLAWRVDRFAGDQARVSVWVVTVLSAVEVAAPQAEWATLTMDLAWVDNEDGDGAWRLVSLRDLPGPTPMTGPADDPWSAQRFDDTLAGFTRLDERSVP